MLRILNELVESRGAHRAPPSGSVGQNSKAAFFQRLREATREFFVLPSSPRNSPKRALKWAGKASREAVGLRLELAKDVAGHLQKTMSAIGSRFYGADWYRLLLDEPLDDGFISGMMELAR
jgi:hypothetical protein